MRQIVKKEFWEDELAKQHFRARLVCLDKRYPETPAVSDYRPIVIASPVIKFLEGLIKKELAVYMSERLNKKQYGFVKGVGIDECKSEMLKKVE